MNKKLIIFLMMFLLLTTFFSCFSVHAQGPQQLENLPQFGEEMTITEDSVFIVDADESAVLGGNLTVWGTSGFLPVVSIIVHGRLVVDGSITCNHANLTIQNEGTLVLQNTKLSNTGVDSLFYLRNDEILNVSESTFLLLGGNTYLTNYGSITDKEWSIEARQERIDFNNDGALALFGSNFSSTAPLGIFHIVNSGDLQLHQSIWEITGGGSIGYDGRPGSFLLNGSLIIGSGQVDGQQSMLRMYNGYMTLIDSRIDTRECSCVYEDSRVVNITNSVVSGIGAYNSMAKVYVANSTISDITNYNNAGRFVMTNGTLSGITNYANLNDFNVTSSTISDITNYNNERTGNFSVTDSTFSVVDMNLKNDGKMIFVSSSLINRGGSVNLANDAELYSRGLILKSESTSANFYVTNNGNITFTSPFIEQATSSDLVSIGAEGKQFAQSSGGTILVMNSGSITEDVASSQDFVLLLIILVVVVAVLGVLIIVRKKKRATVNNQ